MPNRFKTHTHTHTHTHAHRLNASNEGLVYSSTTYNIDFALSYGIAWSPDAAAFV